MMSNKEQLVQEYLNNTGLLIVDKNFSSRNRLLKVFMDIGIKRHLIYVTGNMVEAEQYVQDKDIGVVVSDYSISGGSGFDLFRIVRKKYPEDKKLSQILVTSNISQTAVAKAAEEDVDSFVIKPYTLKSIHENLVNTIYAKLKPSPYILKVEVGKMCLEDKDYQGAVDAFVDATKLHPKPSLALFYLGQAKYFLEEKEGAQEKYEEGLGFNSIHYKCLVGLFEVFMSDKRYTEAYQIVKKIAKYFPANPDRLSQVIRLAIITKSYTDMEDYYKIFTELEQRDDHLINYIGAGMYIAGKYYLLENQSSKAIKVFEKIVISCSTYTKFLRAIVSILVESEMFEEAQKFAKKFPAGTIGQEDFLISDYLANFAPLEENGVVIQKGIELYNQNIKDYYLLDLIVRRMKADGFADKAEPYLQEMMSLYPEKFVSSPIDEKELKIS